MRRLAGGERSTRFEPASQYSQFPLQADFFARREQLGGACRLQGMRVPGAGLEKSDSGTGGEKAVFGLWTTHREVR
ncbi:MAG: hypothetical protein CMB37_02400 [Euryarchaeota archaeon]|nr:hypothetical protein [Euryarchaeota archaeon]